eukprot:TRINITY_DN6959_c0_g1_i1.p1 TRINITY_DN6959_c0_g1~~TRINITY_DN6959_c0_g1_i1.p1  ORF type:complete len:102 (-),score=47.48 TRINITY_DN6959_c0_g1_i1:218-523(-)
MSTSADTIKRATEIETKLKGKLFLGGVKPSAEDAKAFEALLGDNVNLARWVKHMSSFSESERKGWGAAPVELAAPKLAMSLEDTIRQMHAAAAAAAAEKKE